MAKIKTSALISDISGSIGNLTFQQSAGGLIVRTKPVIKAVTNFAQYRVQAALLTANAIFKTLTVAEKKTWLNVRYSMSSNDYSFFNAKWTDAQLCASFNFYRIITGAEPLRACTFGVYNMPNREYLMGYTDGNMVMYCPPFVVDVNLLYYIRMSMYVDTFEQAASMPLISIPANCSPGDTEIQIGTNYYTTYGSNPTSDKWLGIEVTAIHKTMPLNSLTYSAIVQPGNNP